MIDEFFAYDHSLIRCIGDLQEHYEAKLRDRKQQVLARTVHTHSIIDGLEVCPVCSHILTFFQSSGATEVAPKAV